MELKFELYEDGPVHDAGSRPHATIRANGQIFLNRIVVDKLGSPDAVALMYDPRNRVIGIKPTRAAEKHAFRLRRSYSSRSRGRQIAAIPFLRRHKILPTVAIGFLAPTVNRDAVLLLDLNETYIVAPRS
jgi:hypothetical protein